MMSRSTLTFSELDNNQPGDDFTGSSSLSTQSTSDTLEMLGRLDDRVKGFFGSHNMQGTLPHNSKGVERDVAQDLNTDGQNKNFPEGQATMLSYQHSLSSETSKDDREDNQNPFEDPQVNPMRRVSQSSPDLDNNAEVLKEGIRWQNRKYTRSGDTIPASTYSTVENGVPSSPIKCTSTSRRASFDYTEDEWRPLQQINQSGIGENAIFDTENDQGYDGADSEITSGQTIREKISGKRSKTPLTSGSVNNCSGPDNWGETSTITPELTTGQITPFGDKYRDDIPPDSTQYRGGLLSSLLKLSSASIIDRPFVSGASCPATPRNVSGTVEARANNKWSQRNNSSPDRLRTINDSSSILGRPKSPKMLNKGSRQGTGKRRNGSIFDSAKSKLTCRPRLEDEIRITVHIAETISRQNYLLKLCHALMSFGAPTHRLEEYMRMSARVLEIQGSFLYLPGCMIISFDDESTHTTDVRLVKTTQGVNLGLLKDIHEIYKEVVHDIIGVEEATQRLERLNMESPKHNKWVLVIVHGLASAAVAPFAFEGRYIDLPICFILGCILGFLQLIIAPRSDLYSNVFEIIAAVLTSFLARAFGSIQNGTLFCFSAMAQSSIALILPGYMVLCGSLELQSRSMVAGSVRMVYAIIYSLFLGFGITIGTAFYGLLDENAISATTCEKPGMSDYEKWLWVPVFTLCLSIINQAKWKQTPVMLLIGFAGYIVNFFSAKRFPSSAQISNALGAFAVGVLGNLYSRTRHGVAAAALLPAIFVQVPSGLAASGSLLSGLSTANKIINTTTDLNGTAINGTSSVGAATGGLSRSHDANPDISRHFYTLPLVVAVHSADDLNTIVFNVGYSMIQIAIGITVGLFMSAILVYPLGKRRSGLFSF